MKDRVKCKEIASKKAKVMTEWGAKMNKDKEERTWEVFSRRVQLSREEEGGTETA